MNKKGYAYWIEMVLSVIIISVVFVGYLESTQTNFAYKQQENLREEGWQIMKNLDELKLLNSSNFTAMETYITASLSDTTGFDLEYYNSSGCYSVDSGTLGSMQTYCTSINATSHNDVVSIFYTTIEGNESESIRLYMWGKL